MHRCVLVVEDEPLIRMDAVDMLEAAGLNVVELDTAEEALRFTRSGDHQVSAIFTDVNLRGPLTGVDLASIVAGQNPEITLLVTSGRFDTRPDDLPDHIQFILKPWLPLQVLSAMQAAVYP